MANDNFQSKLCIHASNVHQGGGRTLLLALIDALPTDKPIVLILDKRMSYNLEFPENVMVHRVAPSLLSRLSAEWWLRKNVNSQDIVLCFGNLPSLFNLKAKTIVFVQNRYLVDALPLKGFSVKTRLRLLIERIWLSCRYHSADYFIVQTASMKKLLSTKIKGEKSVLTIPFIGSVERLDNTASDVENSSKELKFAYVASGEPHKNHHRLVEAWVLLAEEGFFPTLYLTLNESLFPALCAKIASLTSKHHLRIINSGHLSDTDVKNLYKSVNALIYPSYLESFGMPLIEANQMNLPIIAPELDYVRDLLNPTETFDPFSSISIARAVNRFAKINQSDVAIISPSNFIKQLFKL